MRHAWLFGLLTVLAAGCTSATVDCECYNPPTEPYPDTIEGVGYAVGDDEQAEAKACENAELSSKRSCTAQGGSPGACLECETTFGGKRPSDGKTPLRPIPDSTVPKRR